MLALAILVAFSEAEIDDVDAVSCSLRAADQEVVRLNIAMDNPLLMNLLDSLDELYGDEEDCFKVELAAAGREEVFKRGAKQIHDHDMEVLVGDRAVCPDVVQARHLR